MQTLCLLTFAFFTSLVSPLTQAGSPSPIAAPSSGVVQVLISASDKRGNPVSLSQASLQVYIDEKQAQIRELKPADSSPLRFVLLVDLSGSNIDKLKFERKAASDIFKALSTGNNEGYFGWFNQKVAISARPMQPVEVNQFLNNAKTGGATALYDAIAQACEHKLNRSADSPSARRILFVITDGEDNQSHITAADAANTAEHEGVPVFALGLRSSSPRTTGEAVLKKITHETGGNLVFLDSPKEFQEKLLRPLNMQYVLTFTSPADGQDPHHLEVKSSDRSIEIAAPAGYWAQ